MLAFFSANTVIHCPSFKNPSTIGIFVCLHFVLLIAYIQTVPDSHHELFEMLPLFSIPILSPRFLSLIFPVLLLVEMMDFKLGEINPFKTSRAINCLIFKSASPHNGSARC